MVTTSLKTPTEIFTIPPKWVPISQVSWDYEPSIKTQAGGTVKIVKGTQGTKVVEIRKGKKLLKAYTIQPTGIVKVRTGQVVKVDSEIATMPKKGTVKITETFDKRIVIQVLDGKKRILDEANVPQGTKMRVIDGDVVKVGQKLATIPPQWRNYMDAWAPKALSETFNRYLLNTIIVTVCGIIGVVFSSSFVAYGFARFSFPFRDPLFLIMVSTMMIPIQVTMIPTFILFKYLGWIDTFAPLIIPAFFGGGAFNIFLMRQFFMTIPYELDDAAKIDGCNYFQIFTIIMIPLVKPAMATVAIFGFVYNWNDFLNPLIYLNSSSNFTLALGLQTFTTMYGSSYHLMMAASTIVLFPILIVFFLGQRFFIEGVATSGLKG
ncbi:MAG: ABC transporter permease subunit [Bacteroidales bacterium]|nr:ABC transporter permease subunit [Bacteroidales bacterium]